MHGEGRHGRSDIDRHRVHGRSRSSAGVERTGMLGIGDRYQRNGRRLAVYPRCPRGRGRGHPASTNPRLGHLGLNLLRAGTRRRTSWRSSRRMTSSSNAGSSACLDVAPRRPRARARQQGVGRPSRRPNVGRAATRCERGGRRRDVPRLPRERDLRLWERLLRSLERGRRPEANERRSIRRALVRDREPFAMVDLRVLTCIRAVAELRRPGRRLTSRWFPTTTCVRAIRNVPQPRVAPRCGDRTATRPKSQ